MFIRDMNISDIEQINTDLIIGWGDRKLTSGVAHSTLYTYYNSIRTFLVFVEMMGYMHGVDYKRIRCQPHYKHRVWLRPAEIKQIINAATPATAILIRFIYTAGLRLSEAVSIHGSQLEDGMTIFITGKGSKVRPVFVTKDILDDLRTLSIINGGYCFIDRSCEPLSRKKAYYLIKQAMIKAGYGHAYPHSLRHSFCTELLRKGVSLAHTSRLMGHASVSITQVYEHLITDDIEKAHKQLTKV